MANFAPYQDVPETKRVLSPLASPRTSLDRTRGSLDAARNASQHDYFNAGSSASPDVERVAWDASAPPAPRTGFGRPRADVDMFTTSLGWRLDYEACLAYLLLPPTGGVLLLVLEHQSDYVRFHAWQSSLVFAFAFVVHVIFSWSSWISWLLFLGDVGGIAWLTRRAYVDGRAMVEGTGLGLTCRQLRLWIDMKCHSSGRWRARYWMTSDGRWQMMGVGGPAIQFIFGMRGV
jgi:uncharacterized membrane protein